MAVGGRPVDSRGRQLPGAPAAARRASASARTYTLARSRDNTTATGGNATVAQDDHNLDAEWALSSFDRRHQFTADTSVELPFGPEPADG